MVRRHSTLQTAPRNIVRIFFFVRGATVAWRLSIGFMSEKPLFEKKNGISPKIIYVVN